jgi:hypothetical protein
MLHLLQIFLCATVAYVEMILMQNVTNVIALQSYTFHLTFILIIKKYFKLFLGMHGVTNFPSVGYVVVQHGTDFTLLCSSFVIMLCY